jgi:hypothetical protein
VCFYYCYKRHPYVMLTVPNFFCLNMIIYYIKFFIISSSKLCNLLIFSFLANKLAIYLFLIAKIYFFWDKFPITLFKLYLAILILGINLLRISIAKYFVSFLANKLLSLFVSRLSSYNLIAQPVLKFKTVLPIFYDLNIKNLI